MTTVQPPGPPSEQPQNSLDIDMVRSALEPDYEILAEIGRGGMAVVYRAREKSLDREVAIKVLPSFMVMDAAFVERFQHEARTAGKLEHPNIVPIYRVGSAGRVIYFVMKLLRGQSLAQILRFRPRLGVPEIRRILVETAAALGYAAKHGVVHRDIKPDNILLDGEGRCVITDFGIAKSSGGPHTAAGTSMGTPRYMSPEHARGIPLDGRSDMYSLGVVAYQCLAGMTPFDADDPFAILYKHINEPIPKPALHTEEERQLFAVIEKMLAKAPEDRFQSADELIAALGVTPQSSAPTIMTSGASAFRAANDPTVSGAPPRMSGLSATEIIKDDTLRTRLRIYARDRRVRYGAAGLAALLLVSVLLFAPSDEPQAVAEAPGTTTPPAAAKREDSARGATTAASPAGAATTGGTTGVQSLPQTIAAAPPRADTGRTGSQTTKIGAAATSLRASPPARDGVSRCPRTVRPGNVTVLVDSVGTQRRNSTLAVNYDVCGLGTSSPFMTIIRFRKLNKGRFDRQQDVRYELPAVASGLRSRHQQRVQLAGMSSGQYAMDVIVRDAKSLEYGTTREFRIADRVP